MTSFCQQTRRVIHVCGVLNSRRNAGGTEAAVSERNNMKAKTDLYVPALAIAVLSLGITAGSGQFVDSADLKNRAIAASPRAVEAFPWLARTGAKSVCCVEAVTKSNSTLVEVKKNRALAASPRMLELFPELTRSALPSEGSVATGIDPLTEVTANRALAASPRALETFPMLARARYLKNTECLCN